MDLYIRDDNKLSWRVSKNAALNFAQVESGTCEEQVGTFCIWGHDKTPQFNYDQGDYCQVLVFGANKWQEL